MRWKGCSLPKLGSGDALFLWLAVVVTFETDFDGVSLLSDFFSGVLLFRFRPGLDLGGSSRFRVEVSLGVENVTSKGSELASCLSFPLERSGFKLLLWVVCYAKNLR